MHDLRLFFHHMLLSGARHARCFKACARPQKWVYLVFRLLLECNMCNEHLYSFSVAVPGGYWSNNVCGLLRVLGHGYCAALKECAVLGFVVN